MKPEIVLTMSSCVSAAWLFAAVHAGDGGTKHFITWVLPI